MARRTIGERIAEEARAIEDAEIDQGSPIPPHVKITRGTSRARVLQVRLNDDEYTALERIAALRDLPVSTIARERLLDLIADADDARPVARLRAAVARLESLVGQVDDELGSHRAVND